MQEVGIFTGSLISTCFTPLQYTYTQSILEQY